MKIVFEELSHVFDASYFHVWLCKVTFHFFTLIDFSITKVKMILLLKMQLLLKMILLLKMTLFKNTTFIKNDNLDKNDTFVKNDTTSFIFKKS